MNARPSCADTGSGQIEWHGPWGIGAILLIAFAAVTCLSGLGDGPAMGDHEAINALAARGALQSGKYLIPHLGEVPLVRKPPMGTWLISAASAMTGGQADPPVSEFSARLPSGLAGFANVLILWWLATMFFGRRAGLVGGFIAAGSLATLVYARNAQVDMTLAMFTSLSFACFWRAIAAERLSRRWIAAFAVALSLAMLAKAPLPLAIVGLPLFAYWFITLPLERIWSGGGRPWMAERGGSYRACLAGQYRQALQLIPGLVLFVLLTGAWPVYVLCRVDDAADLWRLEYFSRAAGGLRSKSEPFLYYIPLVFGMAAPFLLSIPEAVASPFLKRYREHRAGLLFAFTWAVVGTIFLSIPSFKRPHYLLSVMPAYWLLLAPVIDRLFFGTIHASGRTVKVACSVLPAVIVAGFAAGAILLEVKYPELGIVRAFVLIAALLAVAWGLSCRAYARQKRAAAFALLNLGTLAGLIIVWPVLGQHLRGYPQHKALAEGLAKQGVGTDAEIYFVDDDPDASFEFYYGYHVRRLIDELDIADFRKDRTNVSLELYAEAGDRIQRHLLRDEPVYLIMQRENYRKLVDETASPLRILLELHGFEEDEGDELIVITQPSRSSRPAA